MSAPWEDFQQPSDGPWQDFGQAKPAPIGAAAFPDFLKQELANADWGTRQIAGFGTAASNAWEALKQFVGKGDAQRVEANKIIEKAAPVGAIAGNVAMTAIPFGMAGNSVGTVAKVGAAMGALNPVEGETVWTKEGVGQKLKDVALSSALSAGGQVLANQAGKWITKKAGAVANEAAENAPRTETITNALDAKLGVVPSEANPTWWTNMLESFGGKSATAKTQATSNAERIPALAREDLMLPEHAALTPQTIQQARDAAYNVAYKPIVNAKSIPNDGTFLQDLAEASTVGKAGAVVNPGAEESQALLRTLASRGEWTGAQLMNDVKSLRQQASANFGSAARDGGDVAKETLARTQRKAADALEELAGRKVGGDAIDLLREARSYIARSHSWEDSLINGSGQFDPAVLARQFDKQVPLSGNAKTVGAAANVFPKSFQDPTKATGADVSVINHLAGMAGGSAAGEFIGDHPGLGAFAGPLALALARKGARSAVLSKSSQNRLRDVYKLGLASRASARALQYAPVAGAVLGREAFSQ